MSVKPGLTDSAEYWALWELVGTASRPWAQLHALTAHRAASDEMRLRLVNDLRQYGSTFKQIGNALGVSRQAVNQLLKRPRT